jgi:hypothetical protein
MTPVSTCRQGPVGSALAVLALMVMICLPTMAGRELAAAALQSEITLCSAHDGKPAAPQQGHGHTLCPFCCHAPSLLSPPTAPSLPAPGMRLLSRRTAPIRIASPRLAGRRPSARDPPVVVIA